MEQQKSALRGERRAHVRYPHTLRTSCRPLGKEIGGAWAATVTDVSRAGVALVMEREVRPGAVLVASLEGLGGRFTRPLLLRVMNVRAMNAWRWQAGCGFVTALTDSDMQALLLAKPAEDEGGG
jgi:hypothetical protein